MVKFDVGNGTTVSVQNNMQSMLTHRGPVPAQDVVQGDYICNLGGEPFLEVVASPVVS